MCRSTRWLFTAVLLTIALADPCLAFEKELVLDQQQGQAGAGHGMVQGSPHWQEFLPTMNNLVAIDLPMVKWATEGNDVSVQVTDFAGLCLWSGSIANADVPETTGWLSVDSAQSTSLMPGAHYRIVVEGVGDDDHSTLFWMGIYDSNYPCCHSDVSWDIYFDDNFYDFGFRTFGETGLNGPVLDQAQMETSYGYISADSIERWQGFRPEYSRLVGFSIALSRNEDLSGTLEVSLLDSSNRILYAVECDPMTLRETPRWAAFHFPEPLPVVPGAFYRIAVRNTSPQEEGYVIWSGASDSVYLPGYSSLGEDNAFDFAFMAHSLPENYLDSPFLSVGADAVLNEAEGSGLNLLDLNGDDRIDVYVVNRGAPNQLLINQGAFGFLDLAQGLIADPGPTVAATWADFDNDGDLDAYLSRDAEANYLLKNDGNLNFIDVAQLGMENTGMGRGVSWIDFDKDGMLDLYLVNSGTPNVLFRNMGEISPDFHFFSSVQGPVQDPGVGTMGIWNDIDLDGDQDLYLVRPNEENLLFENAYPLGFQPWSSNLNIYGNSQGAAWGDFSSDGRMSLYVTNQGSPDKLFISQSSDFNIVSGPLLGDPFEAKAVLWFDFDNDMDQDLFLGRYGQPDLLLENTGNGSFSYRYMPYSPLACNTTAASTADFDNDGHLDLFLVRDNHPNDLLQNVLSTGGNWLKIKLEGIEGCNNSAVGSRIRLVAGGISQVQELNTATGMYSQDPLVRHFGLASYTQADSLIVRWPNGEITIRTDVPCNQLVAVPGNATSSVEMEDGLPTRVSGIESVWPNPFNPRASIDFAVASQGKYSLEVFDLNGKRVATLLEEDLSPGQHSADWTGRDAQGSPSPSGVYFFRLIGPSGQSTQKAVLLK